MSRQNGCGGKWIRGPIGILLCLVLLPGARAQVTEGDSGASRAETQDAHARNMNERWDMLHDALARNMKTLNVDLGSRMTMRLIPVPGGDVKLDEVLSGSLVYAFWVGTYEVTQQQWRAVMGGKPPGLKNGKRPVDAVSWSDCQEFCKKVSAKLRRTVRLPTEAEWVHACRAGGGGQYCFGDDRASLGDYAWYTDNSRGATHAVGSKRPNAWGLYDVHGNVWEYCENVWRSWHDMMQRHDPSAGGRIRVARGGGYAEAAEACSSTSRSFVPSESRRTQYGFRILVPLYDMSRREGDAMIEAQRFIRSGGEIDGVDKYGQTRLHRAAEAGYVQLMWLLLSHGADVNATGISCPHLVLEKIEVGSDSGWTPLHYAVQFTHGVAAALLLVHGADINAKNAMGETALDIALYEKLHHSHNVEAALIVDLLRSNEPRATIFSASALGNLQQVMSLTRAEPALVNAIGSFGQTPLYYAVDAGHVPVADYLLSKGADPNPKVYNDMRPLHYAAEQGNLAMVELLLARRAELDAHDALGWTALHCAVTKGHEALVKLLLSKGADVDARNGIGHSPLHSAVHVGELSLIEILIANGADVNARDGIGKTPLRLAEEGNRAAAAALLRKHGAKR